MIAILNCVKLEKIRISLRDSSDSFESTWGPFIKYLKDAAIQKEIWRMLPSSSPPFLFFLIN